MIIPEWERIITGKESFKDKDVKNIVDEIISRLKSSENIEKDFIELSNDLEVVMGKGEWLTRKYNRISSLLNEPDHLSEKEKQDLQKKMVKVKSIRDKIIDEMKKKYNIGE